MFGLPISTLRYYDKQGLFPNMERASGIRRFSDQEIEALRVIECLKRAGMEIKDIRQFMDWCAEGPSTYPQRKALFEAQRSHMEAELEQMNRALNMLKFKCWYYEQAIKDGSEDLSLIHISLHQGRSAAPYTTRIPSAQRSTPLPSQQLSSPAAAHR